ncbi:hypothetical protein M407DRAFT_28115 [Tulasnella calospora MUT 4182]|uniref:Ras GEF n=1 Tax=Tulasnella calospora MUT 4182 TaxID=1051891 RepID=A0A0C3Q223_9AGAM|nr:hypothetical protein M407DRAFT_28115 [Tulasnella calospora MUT 4182]
MYALRSPHLAEVAGMAANRSSISTDYSDTVSFVSTAPSNVSSVIGDFFVFCLHDYEPLDTDQLGFQKGDILAILRTEENGWWAATQGDAVGWIPSAYVEPISDSLAETMREMRRELRTLPTTDNWETDTSGPNGSSTSLSTSSQRASSEAFLRNDAHVQRRGSGTSSRTYSSEDHTPPPRRVESSSPRPILVSNGTGGFYPDYRNHGASSSISSLQSARGIPFVGSPGQTSARSGRSGHLLQEFPLPSPPGGRPASNRRSSRDDDSVAYRNARIAADALPPHLKPEYGEGYIRLDSDGVVKSGTVEALVERLTVDPLRRSQENAYRTTFLMTYKTFTDSAELFALLVERYTMDPPGGLTDEQRAEWKEKRLRPTQTRVLNTMREWVERYRLVKDEGHLVEKLKDFLGRIDQPASNVSSAKHLLETIGKQEAAVQAAQQQQAAAMAASSSGGGSPPTSTPRRGLWLPIGGASSRSRPHRNDLLKLDPSEVAQHLTLFEYRLYAKIRPSECMEQLKGQSGPKVENLVRFCSTNDRLAAWVKYSILKEDGLGKRADIIDFWIKVAEKCRVLNNVSSVSGLVAGLANSAILKLSLTWAHVSRGSHVEPLTRLTDPSNNFAAYRNFYSTVDTSCVPFVGLYLTQLTHCADHFKEFVLVQKPVPLSGDPGHTTPSSPGSMASLPSLSSSPMTNASGHRYRNVDTITHVNFTRLFKCAEVIHQMLRHQSKGYRQANPSASAPHPVLDPSQAQGINLGVENVAVLSYVETMLATGGVGTSPPPGLPLENPGGDVNETSVGKVGVIDSWYWQRSNELQKVEADTSDIRRGLEAAGF